MIFALTPRALARCGERDEERAGPHRLVPKGRPWCREYDEREAGRKEEFMRARDGEQVPGSRRKREKKQEEDRGDDDDDDGDGNA